MNALKSILYDEETSEENQELKCSICNNFLSVPPILHNTDFGNICGRWQCNSLAHRKGENNQQIAYESVAKFLIFPCMYRDNGCRADLKWNEVSQHENSCSYKNFTCPFAMDHFVEVEKCDWSGDVVEFVQHVESNHLNRVFLNSLELGFRRDVNRIGEIYFSKVLQDIVVVSTLLNEAKTALYCKVWGGFTIFKNLQYRIRVSDESKQNSTSLKKQNVELFSSNIFRKTFDKSWLEINFAYMENFVENPSSIIFEFEYNNIKLGFAKELTLPSINTNDNFYSTELRDAKCDICSKELFPPVFMCIFAHNICAFCKKTENCPKCSSKLAKSRNIAYEKLKFLINQPCKNYTQGCSYIGGYPNIKDHEEICPFKPRKCILGCSFDVDNLLNHLKLEHPLSVSALDTPYNLNRLKLHVFLYDNQIFLFTKKLSTDEGFSFNVQCLGMREMRYNYELHLMNDKFLESGIVLSHTCHPELFDFNKYSNDALRGLTNVILIPNTVLEQMFPDLRSLKFKIRISRLTN